MSLNKNNTLYMDISSYRDSKTTALYFRKKKISFSELLERVDNMARYFKTYGIQKDDVVSLLSPNVPQAIIAFYALNKIGAIVSVLHPLLPPKILLDSLEEVGSSHLLILDARYFAYQKELENVNIPIHFLTASEDLTGFENFMMRRKLKKELSVVNHKKVLSTKKKRKIKGVEVETNEDNLKPSVLLRSGGTTGRNKNIVLNDYAVRYPGSVSLDIFGMDSFKGKSMLGVLPLFHGFGLAMGIHAPLMHEAASCLMIKYDEKELIKNIKQGKVNSLICVPYMARKLLDNKAFKGKMLRNLIMSFVGADKPNPALFKEFDERMKKAGSQNRLYEGYGLTETVTVTFVNTKVHHKEGSVGRPLTGTLVKIVDPNDLSQEVLIGKDGMILISSPANCLGYLNVSKRGQPFYTDRKKRKWVVTNDIGHLDEDGFLYFKNRIGDSFKIAGYNVYPSDIEKLADEVEGVVESAAIYIDGPRPYIHLFIENHTLKDQVLGEAVLNHLRDYLLPYSVPRSITLLPKFPRTAIGKVDRKALLKL